MNTNKYTATRNRADGSTIKVTVERGTWDESVNLDGWDTGMIKTHLVDRTEISLYDKSGKWLAGGHEVKMVTPTTYFRNYKELIAKGAVARVGDAFIGQATVDLINDAIAEADAGAPKTARQIEIETAEAERKAKAEAWRNSPEGQAEIAATERHEWLMRQMDRADSDY